MMTPTEFASKHFKEYKQKGAEIIPTYCPFCYGGQNSDKYTFALNIENETYNCKRGSCDKSGHFSQLLKHFGENAPTHEIKRPTKTYKKPKTEVNPATKKVEDYLILRGISKDVWQHFGVGEHKGNIAFPYYDETGQLTLMKFRKPEKYTGNGQKAWREEGGKAIFWGMQHCRPGKPLIITEGEFDALSLAEVGLVNVASVPSGAEDLTCVDHCWDWLEQFRKIIIWPDNDEPGQEMCQKLINKLGSWRCAVVETEHKDANECLYKAGVDAVIECVDNAKDVPIAGLKRLADVKAFDYEGLMRIRSSIGLVNKYTAGFRGGEVSIWTGDSGSGKSTFAGQELLEAIEQNITVCAYSGELPAPVFRYWIDLQAAGKKNLSYKYDSFQQEEKPYVSGDIERRIREWYKDYFFLCDENDDITDQNVLQLFEYAAKRYDCKVFLIDNLMSMAIEGSNSDYYRKQSEFMRQTKQFARNYDVHVHVVAHPRKTDPKKGEGRLTKSDVAGAKDITNWADNVFCCYRVKEGDADGEYKSPSGEKYSTVIDLFKCRFTGVVDKTVGLMFEPEAKRFYQGSDPRINYKYGWESHREPPRVMAGGIN